MRGVMGARRAQTGVFDKAHRTNRLATVIRSQALSVVAIGALLATTLVLSHETPAQASAPAACSVPGGYSPTGWDGNNRAITNKNDLIWLSLNQTNNMGANYILTADIDLGGCNWLPIGSNTVPFTGKFDGLKPGSTTDSFTISGLRIANRSDEGNGLFGWVEGVGREVADRAKIHNLIIEGVNFSGISGANTGALAGQIGNAIVENVHVSGTITTSGINSGGLIGQAGEATVAVPAPIDVRSSSSAVAVLSTDVTVGGLIGDISNNSRGSLVIDSFATGSVQGLGTIGGLIGKLGDSSPGERTFENRVVRSYAAGDVTGGSFSAVGGLVGEAYGVILYSYAKGNVTGRNEVGGLVGNFQSRSNPDNLPVRKTPVIKDSYSTGNVLRTGNDSGARAGGLIGRLRAAGPVERSYSIGSVTDESNANQDLYFRVGGFAGYEHDNGTPTFEEVTENLVGNFWSFTAIGGNVPPNSIGFFPNDNDIERPEKVTRSTSAAMTSFATYDAAGWAIINGKDGVFCAPDGIVSGEDDNIIWGGATQGTDQVWGIDPTVNSGYPFLLWQENPVCGPQVSTGQGVQPATPQSRERQASAPAIHLDLQANVGDRVSGAPVVVGGEGLSAGSSMTLVVRSTPQTLVSGRVSSLGNFSTRASLPALSPGSHTLTLTGTAPDGAVLTLVQGFVVGADGTFTSIGQPAGSQTGGLAATGVPANAGLLFAVSSLMLLAIGLSLLRVRSRHQFTE